MKKKGYINLFKYLIDKRIYLFFKWLMIILILPSLIVITNIKDTYLIIIIIYIISILFYIVTRLSFHSKFKTVLIFFNRNNRVLIINKGQSINVIGGKVEEYESISDAVFRESYEETNLMPLSYTLSGLLKFKDETKTEYMYIYTVHSYHGLMESSEEGEVSWVDIDKLDYSKLWDGDKVFFKDILNHKFIKGKLTYKEDKLTDYKIKVFNN